MIPFISAVGEAIASKPTLNTNCGEPGNGTPKVAKYFLLYTQ